MRVNYWNNAELQLCTVLKVTFLLQEGPEH